MQTLGTSSDVAGLLKLAELDAEADAAGLDEAAAADGGTVRARRAAARRVGSTVLTHYEALRARGRSPLSIVSDGHCGACRLRLADTLHQSLKRGALATCPGCHRILCHSDHAGAHAGPPAERARRGVTA